MPPLLPLSMLYPSYLLHVYPQYQRWYADAKAPAQPASSYSELARRYEAARIWESLARREMTSPASTGGCSSSRREKCSVAIIWIMIGYRPDFGAHDLTALQSLKGRGCLVTVPRNSRLIIVGKLCKEYKRSCNGFD